MSQKQTVLRAFYDNKELTPSDIMKLGVAQYNARIFELKKEGHIIESVDLGTQNGIRLTKFIYKGKRGEYKSSPSEKPQEFPSLAHKIAHDNRIKSEAEKSNQEQLQLI